VLASCGSDDDSNGAAAAAADSATTATAAGGSAATTADGASSIVSIEEVEGFGGVLVDAEGLPLYTADEEVDAGEVLCVDACTQFWVPLEAGDEEPMGMVGDVELGVIERPDGTLQVTADEVPLYTFVQDSPGDVTGDGFSDAFDGQQLTWHAVVVEATTSSSTPTDSTDPADSSGGVSASSGTVPDYPGY
jgi:predicted lipoprotein with Yx(FWY)xxD motif